MEENAGNVLGRDFIDCYVISLPDMGNLFSNNVLVEKLYNREWKVWIFQLLKKYPNT